jgi:hypothetical protein
VTVYRLKDAGHGGFVFYSAENAKHLCEFLEAVCTTK